MFSCCHSPASRSFTLKLERSLVMWVSSVTALTTSEAVTRMMEAVSGARSRRVWAQDTPAIPPPRTTKSALALRSQTSWAISLLQVKWQSLQISKKLALF